MNFPNSSKFHYHFLVSVLLLFSQSLRTTSLNLYLKQHQQPHYGGGYDFPTYIWPLPWHFTSGNQTLTVDYNLQLNTSGNGGVSRIVSQAFDRYKRFIFEHASFKLPSAGVHYDLESLNVLVHSDNEELQLGVDESYTLLVAAGDEHSVIGEITIEANSVYGALHGLETLSSCVLLIMGAKP